MYNKSNSIAVRSGHLVQIHLAQRLGVNLFNFYFIFFVGVLEMKIKRSCRHSTDDAALWNEISPLRVKEILDGYFKL